MLKKPIGWSMLRRSMFTQNLISASQIYTDISGTNLWHVTSVTCHIRDPWHVASLNRSAYRPSTVVWRLTAGRRLRILLERSPLCTISDSLALALAPTSRAVFSEPDILELVLRLLSSPDLYLSVLPTSSEKITTESSLMILFAFEIIIFIWGVAHPQTVCERYTVGGQLQGKHLATFQG